MGALRKRAVMALQSSASLQPVLTHTCAEPPSIYVRYWPACAHMHISVRFVLQFMSLSLCPPPLSLSPSVHALLFSVCSILSQALITSTGFCSPWV